jgi:homoserine kinase type II
MKNKLGVKTKITKEDLPSFLKADIIYETKSGVSDTVYICDDKNVVKLFENSTEETIRNEMELLDMLKDISAVKLYSKEIIYIKNKPALVYEKCRGKILDKAEDTHIRQIGVFLRKLHTITKGKTSSNKKLFEKESLNKLIGKTEYSSFKEIFESIDIILKHDGIIHGDLFLDNALFQENKLSCVIDLSEACSGDFLFDLAVVALSWCRNDDEIKLLLDSYGNNIKLERFKEYIKYAALYYSVTRFLDNRDYKELLDKIKGY